MIIAGLHNATHNGYIFLLGEAALRLVVQQALDIVVTELVPLPRLQEVGEQILARRNGALKVEPSPVPYVARILLLFQQPEARQEQALYHSPRHNHTVFHFLAQTKDAAVSQGAHVYKVGLYGIPINLFKNERLIYVIKRNAIA